MGHGGPEGQVGWIARPLRKTKPTQFVPIGEHTTSMLWHYGSQAKNSLKEMNSANCHLAFN